MTSLAFSYHSSFILSTAGVWSEIEAGVYSKAGLPTGIFCDVMFPLYRYRHSSAGGWEKRCLNLMSSKNRINFLKSFFIWVSLFWKLPVAGFSAKSCCKTFWPYLPKHFWENFGKIYQNILGKTFWPNLPKHFLWKILAKFCAQILVDSELPQKSRLPESDLREQSHVGEIKENPVCQIRFEIHYISHPGQHLDCGNWFDKRLCCIAVCGGLLNYKLPC